MRHLVIELVALTLIAIIVGRYVAGDKAGRTNSLSIPVPEMGSAQEFSDGRYSGSVVRTTDTRALLVYSKSADPIGYAWVGSITVLLAIERVRRYRSQKKKSAEQFVDDNPS